MAGRLRQKALVKVAVSLVMVALLFYSVDLEKLRLAAGQLSISSVILVALGYIGTQFVSSVRWWILLRGSGVSAGYGRTLKAFFIGMYLNCFGLGTVGGDVARGLLVASSTSERARGLGSVVADRVLGLAVLAAIGVISALIFHVPSMANGFLTAAILVVCGLPLFWFLGPALVRRVLRSRPTSAARLESFLAAFPSRPRVLVSASLVALVFHLLQISLFGLITVLLGAPVPWPQLFTAIPFVNIASTLPLSWMGLGVRENAYVIFFVPEYLTSEQVVLAGAVWLAGMTLAGAAGGLVAFLSGGVKDSAEKNPSTQP